MQGLVIKKNATLFSIESNNHIYVLNAMGKNKEGGIFVGDKVEFNESITKVYTRKNLLIRPPLANIDKMFLVIALKPKPDFVLIDKMIIYCMLNNIEPIIVINKCDIADNLFIKEIENDYFFLTILKTSAKDGKTSSLKEQIYGICAFAGQSAVGKSSLINSMLGYQETSIGDISKKIERGKQTTRIVSLYKIGNGYIADTAGFSMLDLSLVSKITARELSSYYPDFIKAREECKYRSCLHESGECGVINYVNNGKISCRRYRNYLKILNELKDKTCY